ncbi:type II toxin-antitoxin system VapC family toxin [Desulfobulbus sp. US1]|nr:type II toxin-antitoxin system VapC family toxin [Desulfobulbus sp. US4]MCW5209562.1 type II toxin-antitoxin system VapC family toxin [Desulfobulbus sp. US1]WLE96196.1 MAG: type II toxin-antitoxin system VapC family toxin [Candidatus Electrothrix communis]
MILLDTNILSEPMRPSPSERVISWLDQQVVTDLFICAVTKAEIELGIALLPEGRRKQSLFSAAQEIFSKFSKHCLAFGATEASIYAGIIADARKKGKTMTVEDGLIAAVAVSNGFSLATRNIKDFNGIAELPLINPFEG